MTTDAEARALASPLRMRILRSCLHKARTNKEIAEILGMNPGTTLHHVRTLVQTGFLRAEEPRRGARGAREVPYLATRRSWDADTPGAQWVLVQTFLDEAAEVAPDDLHLVRLGLKLRPDDVDELHRRLIDLLIEFKDKPAAPDGEAISVFTAIHPDRTG